MTRDMVKALKDEELVEVGAWVQDEQRGRSEQHRQETITRIREMARSIDLSIKIEGVRGRPPKARRGPIVSTTSERDSKASR